LIRQSIRVLAWLVLVSCLATAQAAEIARIAIIIDDLGYNQEAGYRAVHLPGPVACAILPATPRGPHLAEIAAQAGKEVLLHLPLQAQSDSAISEPGGIDIDMSRDSFASTFASSLQSVPHAIGVNSHRGSLLTRHPGHMSWLMEEIKAAGSMFFVDSYTTHQSVALKFAHESGVPAVRRDVFLDPDKHPETVVREFARLKKLARIHGMAVGIGHPYPETLALLERELPKLKDEGIDLISISRYVSLKSSANKD
jgi:polysaccharide deacetylase 2 family uncharacterized protein YibQ